MEKLDAGKKELCGIELIDENDYIFMTSLFKIFLIFHFSKHKEIFFFFFSRTYRNLVSYTFVSRTETFIFFSLPDPSGIQKFSN